MSIPGSGSVSAADISSIISNSSSASPESWASNLNLIESARLISWTEAKNPIRVWVDGVCYWNVDLGLIPGRVKPKTIQIGINSFAAWHVQ